MKNNIIISIFFCLVSVANILFADPGSGMSTQLTGLPKNIHIGQQYPITITFKNDSGNTAATPGFGVLLPDDPSYPGQSTYPSGFTESANTCGGAVELITLPLDAICQITGDYTPTITDISNSVQYQPIWHLLYVFNGGVPKPEDSKDTSLPFQISSLLSDSTVSTQSVTVFTPKAEQTVTAEQTIKNNTGQELTTFEVTKSGDDDNKSVSSTCPSTLAAAGTCVVTFSQKFAANEPVDKVPTQSNNVTAKITYDDQVTSSNFTVNFKQVNGAHFITLPIEQSTLATPATSFDRVNIGNLPSNVINKLIEANGTLYAATPQGVAQSADFGQSWTTMTPLYNSLNGARVNDMAYDGSNLNIATNGGLQQLRTGSTSFSTIRPKSGNTYSQNLTHVGAVSGTVLASNIDNQLQLSTSSIEIKALDETAIPVERSISAISLWKDITDPDNKKVVAYVGTDNGLFKCADITAESPVFTPDGLAAEDITHIATSSDGASDSTVVAATTATVLYVSTNGGAFTPITAITGNITDIKIVDGYTVPNGTDDTGTTIPAEIYVTTSAGLFKLPAGSTAASSVFGGDFTNIDVADNHYFLGVANEGVSTTPLTSTTLVAATGTTTAGIAGVPTGAFAVAANGEIYVGTETGLAESTDKGATFTPEQLTSQGEFITAVVTDGTVVGYGTARGDFYVKQAGEDFKLEYSLGHRINDIAVHKEGDLYYATANGVYKENTVIYDPAGDLNQKSVSVSEDGIKIVSASATKIYISLNSGDSFQLATLPPVADLGTINNVRIIGSSLYVATSTGLWKGTVSNTPSLTKVSNFPDEEQTDISVNNISSPDKTQLYVSTAEGLYISDTTGKFPTKESDEKIDQKTISDGLAGNNVLKAVVVAGEIYTGTTAGISMTQQAADSAASK
jgi:hypothetical protein